MGPTARQIAVRAIEIALALGMIAAGSPAQESSSPPMNLQVMRTLAGRIGSASLVTANVRDSAGIQLTVLPRETGWIIEDALGASFAEKHRRTAGVQPAYGAEYGVLELHVGYENIRRDGFFGPKIVDRVVRVVLHARIAEMQSGAVLLSRDLTEEARDTVFVSGIDRLESTALPLTKGELPPEGFFSTIAEPIVVLGTVAVAVILLFTVRS